jgi:HlyD family secretion protein
MRRWIRSSILPLVAVGALAFAAVNVIRAQSKSEHVAPAIAPAATPFRNSVAGAGIAEPRTENIAVGTHVGGVVAQVFVKVGTHVQAGDSLYRIDDRQLRGTLAVREAALASAEAELSRLEKMPRPEELPAGVAKIDEAKANLEAQQDLFERSRRLRSQSAISEEEFVRCQQGFKAVQQQLARAEAEYALLRAGAWEPDKAVARAAVTRAKAEVEQTRLDMDRLLVRAPLEGDVLQVNVRLGEYVSTPHSLAPIVLGDLHTLHVRIDIDEHDIARFAPGLPAKATVRGDSHRDYPLTFVRVEPYVIPKKSLTGDSSERVDTRVLQVIYAFRPGERSVYVGQQLDVFIDVSSTAAAMRHNLAR